MPNTQAEGKKCFRRGSPRHRADKCSHTKTTYNYCKKTGHLAKVCFKKRGKVKTTLKHTMLLLHLLGKQFQVELKRLLTINSQST